MNSVEMADHFINRAKMLQEFTITVEIPEDFRFPGFIPFDLKIADGEIHAKVYGISFDEALERFHAFMESCK